MFIILCIFLIVSFFELLHLLKQKKKKEAVIYMVITAATIFLAAFLMLNPGYQGFARSIINLFGSGQ